MPLKWGFKESPIPSSKLNKMSVTFWADEASIDTDQVRVGSLVYLEDEEKLKVVASVDPLELKNVGGGGGMIVDGEFGRLSEINPSDGVGYGFHNVIVLHPMASFSSGRQAGPQVVSAVEAVGGAVATFSDSLEFRGVTPITFNGFPIGKIFIAVPLYANASYSSATSGSLKFNATNTKIEILDGATVKKTITLPDDRSTSNFSATSKQIGTTLSAIVDLEGFVFTDFRIKVYISSTVSTTSNLTEHRHYYIAQANSQNENEINRVNRSGRLQVEVLA